MISLLVRHHSGPRDQRGRITQPQARRPAICPSPYHHNKPQPPAACTTHHEPQPAINCTSHANPSRRRPLTGSPCCSGGEWLPALHPAQRIAAIRPVSLSRARRALSRAGTRTSSRQKRPGCNADPEKCKSFFSKLARPGVNFQALRTVCNATVAGWPLVWWMQPLPHHFFAFAALPGNGRDDPCYPARYVT